MPLREEGIKREVRGFWGERRGLMPLSFHSLPSSLSFVFLSTFRFSPQQLSNGLVSVTTAASVLSLRNFKRNGGGCLCVYVI